MNRVEDVRRALVDMYSRKLVITHEKDPAGDVVELLSAQFLADQPVIFGEENEDYVQRELDWYLSQSLSVRDIKPPVPKIWESVSGAMGVINSNYGWMILSEENGSQLENCARALVKDPRTRQACMIYQRPSMHVDATRLGMRDFVCTDAVHCFVRPWMEAGHRVDALHYLVYMRSNDAVFGYKNDLAWHRYVQDRLLGMIRGQHPRLLDLRRGPIVWHAASLHVYRRHFKYLATDDSPSPTR